MVSHTLTFKLCMEMYLIVIYAFTFWNLFMSSSVLHSFMSGNRDFWWCLHLSAEGQFSIFHESEKSDGSKIKEEVDFETFMKSGDSAASKKLQGAIDNMFADVQANS